MAKINEKSNGNRAVTPKSVPVQQQDEEQERQDQGPLVSPQQTATAASATGTQRDEMFTTSGASEDGQYVVSRCRLKKSETPASFDI